MSSNYGEGPKTWIHIFSSIWTLHTGITLPQDQSYEIKHPLRALQVKNRSTLAVPPFMSSMMSSTLHFALSHPFCSSIPKAQEEAKTKPLTRTRRTLAKMMVDLAQCFCCTARSSGQGRSPLDSISGGPDGNNNRLSRRKRVARPSVILGH